MDELKLLIEMVSNLPQMAMWVLVGFWAYKVIVIGSVYGLIKFITLHLYKVLTAGKVTNEIKRLDDLVIDGNLDDLITQIKRCRRSHSSYLHASGVEWLKQAIDDKEAKDAQERASRFSVTKTGN